jgi:hypothetical protein
MSLSTNFLTLKGLKQYACKCLGNYKEYALNIF